MFKYFLLPAFLFVLTGCDSLMQPRSSASKQDEHGSLYDHAAYDEKYKGTKDERQAFDESTWDEIETELRDRPR